MLGNSSIVTFKMLLKLTKRSKLKSRKLALVIIRKVFIDSANNVFAESLNIEGKYE